MVPLILFAFNRPQKLQLIVNAILGQSIKPHKIVAFLDGPREKPDHKPIAQCLQILESMRDRVDIEIMQRSVNVGCPRNIMNGVHTVASNFDKFVVLEDDTLPSGHWYEAMVSLLDAYNNSPEVVTVGSFPSVLSKSLDSYAPDVILSPRFSCWGWGSWSSKWFRFYDDWWSHCQGGQPWRFDGISGRGGHDIVNAMRFANPGQYWDVAMATTMLANNWKQAIPKWYMVRNIGADVHLEPARLDLMYSHNSVTDRVPVVLPGSTDFDDRVCDAVCDYVRVFA